MAFYVSVYFLFYAPERLVNLPVVFFVIAADLANERHQHKETPTDNRNHNFISHVMPLPLVELAALDRKTRHTRLASHQTQNQYRRKCF